MIREAYKRVCTCGATIAEGLCDDAAHLRVTPNGCEACKPKEPTAVFASCPDCGRSKSKYLTLSEAFERHGYSKSNCLTCRLTNVSRG